jgi:hypothetical protein
MEKIVKFSRGNVYVFIGQDENNGKWYSPSRVNKFMGSISVGDPVNIKSERIDKTNYLTFIQKANGTSQPEVTSADIEPTVAKEPIQQQTASTVSKAKTSWRSPEEMESIKRQAIMHAVSRSLIALQGQYTSDNIEPVIRKLYSLYQELVG